MGGVALERGVARTRVAGLRSKVLRLMDLQTDVGDNEGMGLICDVNDPRGTHTGLRPELIELDQIRVAVNSHGNSVLRDAHWGPGQARDQRHRGVHDPGLHLRRIEDEKPIVDSRCVGPIAVVADG